MASTKKKQPSDILKSLLKSFELDQTVWSLKLSESNIHSLHDLRRLAEDSSLYTHLTTGVPEIEIQRLKCLIIMCEEDFQRTNDQKLKTYLQENGFEPLYWLPVFKICLGVRSKEAMENIGSESYALLAPFAQNKSDKTNLKILLGLNQTSFKECRDTQVKAALERSTQIQHLTKILENLNQLSVEEDKILNNIKSKICEQFQTVSDIPCGTSLDHIIKNLNMQISHLSDTSTKLNNSEVFKMASNGIALQGILMVQDFSEKIKGKDKPLLQTPGNIEFLHPRWEQFSGTIHFSQECHEKDFLKAMQQLGISELFLSMQGCSAEVKDEKSYLSSIRYEIVPMASCYIGDDHIKLSYEAIDYLKENESCICSDDEEQAKSICSQFLHEFGSHVFKGYYHFGGVFLCTATTKDFSIENDTIKCSHNQLNDHIVKSLWLPNELDLPAVVSKCNLTLEKTKTMVKPIGGPSDFLSYSQWKNALVTNNASWCLIDRGRVSIPVWKIIKVQNKVKNFNISRAW